MNTNNLTIKSQEVLSEAVNIAQSNSSQAIEPLHILYALIKEENSLPSYLITKVGVSIQNIIAQTKKGLEQFAKVSGGDAYFSPQSEKVFGKAQKIAEELSDKFIAPEHILIAMAEIDKFLPSEGVTAKELKTALKELRKGDTIDSQTSDKEFDTLNRYAI
ncbi:MAG: Clp protease N-terminal domain-containing protein, partial [Rikenellaceae bacterium]